jgi:hypothetical protein
VATNICLILLKRQYQTLGNKGSNFSEYILSPKSPIFIYNSVGYRNLSGEHPLVSGEIDGEIIEGKEGIRRFEFTWDGVDEMDPVNGSGWMELVEPDKIEGKIKIHQGDSSTFAAERAQK